MASSNTLNDAVKSAACPSLSLLWELDAAPTLSFTWQKQAFLRLTVLTMSEVLDPPDLHLSTTSQLG